MLECSTASTYLLANQVDHKYDTFDQALHPSELRSPSIMHSSASHLKPAVLEYLQEIEYTLSQLEPHLSKFWDESDSDSDVVNNASASGKVMPETRARRPRSLSTAAAIQDTQARVQHVLDMLHRTRLDIHSFFPEMPSLSDVRSHVPPETSKSFLPTLKSRLDSLHEHTSSLKLPSSLFDKFPSFSVLPSRELVSELIYRLQDSDALTGALKTPSDATEIVEKIPPSSTEVIQPECQYDLQVQRALKESNNGKQLIPLESMPQKEKYNQYVKTGYRFIPLSAWPRLFLSLFQLHNQSANIYTHLIPLLYSLSALWIEGSIYAFDIPRFAFVLAANFCLLASCIYHTMSGCSDRKAYSIAVKLDYIGIGWLTSISSFEFSYYGFACHPTTALVHLTLAISQGIAGSILPFQAWFDDPAYTNRRVTFFVTLAFANLAPLTHLCIIYSARDMWNFFLPTLPSLLSYAFGLVFYFFRIPESLVSDKWRRYTDLIGGGSHAIWHVFVVIAIQLYTQAIVYHQNGIGNQPKCELTWNW